MGIKKGVPLYSNLVNLKSNTMKNIVQRYLDLHYNPNIYDYIVLLLQFIKTFIGVFKTIKV